MPKLNRSGHFLNVGMLTQFTKMRSRLDSDKQRLIFEISLWTGERMGAITQLQVSDIWDEKGLVKEYLTFRGETRKGSRWGTARTRHVLIHDELRYWLKNYRQPESGYLFPSALAAAGHITVRGVDNYWRSRFKDMGLTGFSTHSSRRWVINTLAKTMKLEIIADTMAMNILTVKRYLDRNDDACELAIASLSV